MQSLQRRLLFSFTQSFVIGTTSFTRCIMLLFESNELYDSVFVYICIFYIFQLHWRSHSFSSHSSCNFRRRPNEKCIITFSISWQSKQIYYAASETAYDLCNFKESRKWTINKLNKRNNVWWNWVIIVEGWKTRNVRKTKKKPII